MLTCALYILSTGGREACRFTFMAKTFVTVRGTGHGARVRASLVNYKGCLDMHDREGPRAKITSHVWTTDYDSLYEHLRPPKANHGEHTEIVDSGSGDYLKR